MKGICALLTMLSALLLAGCRPFEKPFERAALPEQPGWSDAAAPGGAAVAAATWWTAFRDKRLDRLVDEVLASNNDLAAAGLRVYRARLQAGIADTNRLPQFNGQLGSSLSEPLSEGPGRSTRRSSQFSVGASYELDLWGRLAALRDAAAFEASATEEDLASTRIAIIAATLETYWRLAHANEALAIAERNLAYTRQTQQLVNSQRRLGAVSELEVQEAEQAVQNQMATLAELKQNRQAIRTQLVVLLNGRSSPVAEPLRLPGRAIPAVDPGLPASLLSRRPDLRAAELRLRATLKGVETTRASFYPTVSLTGSLGTSSTSLVSILRNPVATLGTGIVLPFLNLERMDLTVKVSETRYEEAVVGFRGSLLRAFSDVANALNARAYLAERGRRLQAALAAAREVERLTEQRYRSGAVSLRVWLDAQERRRSTELVVVTNRLSRLLNASALYRAIGG